MPPPDARNRILDAAEAVALREGARRLTLDAAAREAGVSKGGVLYHFPNKTALLAGMLERMIEEGSATIERHRAEFAGQANPTLRALVQTGWEMSQCRSDIRVALITGLSEDPTLMEPVRALFDRFWAQVRKECPDEVAAFAIWSAVEGFQFFNMFDVCPLAAEQAPRLFERLMAMIDALPAEEVSP